MNQQNSIVSTSEIDQMAFLLANMNFSKIQMQINQAINANASVLILVGSTGSGKSTIFNWLNDAQFKIVQNGINKELQLKSTDANFQQMKESLVSVTAIPKCLYNAKHNHLVIDFPGFGDTHGWVNQFIIKLMLNKILKLTNPKIAFITVQSSAEFAERGTQLFTGLFNLMQNGLRDSDEITLILNRYFDEYGEDETIEYVRSQLRELSRKETGQIERKITMAASKNILLLQRVNSEQKLQTLMGEQVKNKIWQRLKASKPVQISEFKIEHKDKVLNFFQNAFEKYYQQVEDYFQEISIQINYIETANLQWILQELQQLQNSQFNTQVQLSQDACQVLSSFIHSQNLPQVDHRLPSIFELVSDEEIFSKMNKKHEERQKNLLQNICQQISIGIKEKQQFENLQQQHQEQISQFQSQIQASMINFQKEGKELEEGINQIKDINERNEVLKDFMQEQARQTELLKKSQIELLEKQQKLHDQELQKMQQMQSNTQNGWFQLGKMAIGTVAGVFGGPALGVAAFGAMQFLQ